MKKRLSDSSTTVSDSSINQLDRPVSIHTVIGLSIGVLVAGQSITMAQGFNSSDISAEDINSLREEGADKGWTFTVSANPATTYDLSELTGLVIPENWREGAPFDNPPPMAGGIMADAFDWRQVNGMNYCTPVRNQSGCGSCWAFAVMGSMESGIKRAFGTDVNLSEQWLVSCCGLGGCSGEWPGNAAEMLLTNGAQADQCGESGAVLESAFPYLASDASCACPYKHPYSITGWSFIGPEWGTPTRNQLKQAILENGPITVCVAVNGAFQAYSGGIFNADNTAGINHAVVLVGWDDSQGEEGVWIMRNSWGTGWGEDGYMRIAYGNSQIGYNALYLETSDSINGGCCVQGGCLFGPEASCLSIGGQFLGAGIACQDGEACIPECPADVTGDGRINANDILALLAAWGCSDCEVEDIDGSGQVGANDLLAMLDSWNECD